jgi:hypothetical protein
MLIVYIAIYALNVVHHSTFTERETKVTQYPKPSGDILDTDI